MTKPRPTGILNPFEEPKPALPAMPPYEDRYGLEDEEAPLRPKPRLDLDGDSYIVRFADGQTTIKNVAVKLLELLYAVNSMHEQHLTTHGIHVDTPCDLPGYVTLKQDTRTASVYADTETEAFRRIGLGLWTLPDKQVLNKYHVKIIRRA